MKNGSIQATIAPHARLGRLAQAVFCLAVCLVASRCPADAMDELALDRWPKLREVERYQLQIAERYYKQQDWKAALSEYEKFLSLYQRSEGASYAQLKWGLCQVKIRRGNTAIKDGFQSVLDYWPDSPEAPLAKYYIGRTYKEMGQLGKAKKAYARVVQEHAQHLVAVQALTDLLQIAQIEGDTAGRVEVWKKLAFQIKRSAGMETLCRDASTQLASYYFAEAAFDEGVQALATSFAPAELPGQIAAYLAAALRQMASGAETRQKADNLASRAVAYLRQQSPAGVTSAAQQESLRQTLYAVADVHAAGQQDAKVVKVYAEIASRCGPSDETLARLAAWQETKEKFDEAAKTYRGFAKKVDGLERLAASCRRRQRYDAAVSVYLEILPLDATRKTAWMAEIAATYREARKYKEAIDVYQQLVAANPAEAGKWLDQIALTYRYARHFAEAVSTYRELLKVDPANTPNWLWQMAGTHRDASQWKEAIACYRQCTNFPDNYRAMAECHRRLGQYKEALMLYGQIVGDPAAAPGALLAIADTWEEAGKKEEAIKALQRVCKRCPKSPQASQAHARLQAVYKISITLGGATEE